MTDTKEFIMKDKFSYTYDGYEKFYFVDEQINIYDVDKIDPMNIYLWKTTKPGDKITLSMKGKWYNIAKIN